MYDSNLTTAAAKLVGSIQMCSGKSSAYKSKLLNNSTASAGRISSGGCIKSIFTGLHFSVCLDISSLPFIT